jgi:hypothetical protein
VPDAYEGPLPEGARTPSHDVPTVRRLQSLCSKADLETFVRYRVISGGFGLLTALIRWRWVLVWRPAR